VNRNSGVAKALSDSTPAITGPILSRVDLLIWQIMLVPDRIENPASAGEAKAENPSEVPHR
jgi:hypothetical protein